MSGHGPSDGVAAFETAELAFGVGFHEGAEADLHTSQHTIIVIGMALCGRESVEESMGKHGKLTRQVQSSNPKPAATSPHDAH